MMIDYISNNLSYPDFGDKYDASMFEKELNHWGVKSNQIQIIDVNHLWAHLDSDYRIFGSFVIKIFII